MTDETDKHPAELLGLARRMMTDAEREEIAEIERRAKERSDAAARELFGSAAGARHPRFS